MINASNQYVTTIPGAAFFDHPASFAMMRGGRLDIAVLGAYQGLRERCSGELGHAGRELSAGGRRGDGPCRRGANGFVIMRHTDRNGAPKILRKCTYPLTGAGVVTRIYTDFAVLDVTSDGLKLVELSEGNRLDEVQAVTEAAILA